MRWWSAPPRGANRVPCSGHWPARCACSLNHAPNSPVRTRIVNAHGGSPARSCASYAHFEGSAFANGSQSTSSCAAAPSSLHTRATVQRSGPLSSFSSSSSASLPSRSSGGPERRSTAALSCRQRRSTSRTLRPGSSAAIAAHRSRRFHSASPSYEG
eukprot:6091675-Prymnesium_polylepis.1